MSLNLIYLLTLFHFFKSFNYQKDFPFFLGWLSYAHYLTKRVWRQERTLTGVARLKIFSVSPLRGVSCASWSVLLILEQDNAHTIEFTLQGRWTDWPVLSVEQRTWRVSGQQVTPAPCVALDIVKTMLGYSTATACTSYSKMSNFQWALNRYSQEEGWNG